MIDDLGEDRRPTFDDGLIGKRRMIQARVRIDPRLMV